LRQNAQAAQFAGLTVLSLIVSSLGQSARADQYGAKPSIARDYAPAPLDEHWAVVIPAAVLNRLPRSTEPPRVARAYAV
jgi:hypothetical protein